MTSMNCPRSVGRVAQHRAVERVGEAVEAGDDAARAAPPAASTRSSAIFTVRVTCGSIARIGSSKSFSNRLTRSAVSLRLVIVALKFSKPFISSSAPRRSWSNDRMTAAIGPATSEMTSANGSVRPVSAMGAHASEVA